MKLLKNAAAAGTCLAALAFAAPAGAQTVNAFTTQNVIQALTNLGIAGATTSTVNGPQGPSEIVRFEANGLKHVAALEVCNTGAAGCLGLNIITLWNDVPGVDLNTVNEFNISFSFGKAVGAGSNLAVSRYAISDGGVSTKNVQANLSNHAAMAVNFMEFYRNGASASSVSLDSVSAKPAVADVAALPGLAGIAPFLSPNDFNESPRATAVPASTHAAPR
ncbi:MAG: hypothetical protein HXY23_02595 [Parvularculaceae bacterium]|jgi:hypothetical protein|nr:hypothetical protein [Parvularculaceae bacterium]